MENGGLNSQHISNDAEAPRSATGEGSAAAGGRAEVEHGYMRKAEEYIPITNIMRIMRRILPPQAKVADDTKETVQACVTEFISYVTAEANDICHRDCRKIVTAEDVISAMTDLGFDDYVGPLTLFLRNHRAQDPDRSVVLPGRRGGNGPL